MAVTLDQYCFYDSGAGANVTEDGWRAAIRNVRTGDGVIRNVGSVLAPLGDSSGMQVKVGTGEGWIAGNWGKGTSQKTLSVAAAHASLGRRDLVVLRNDFSGNKMELDVLTGTPGASPTYPNLTQNSSIWEIQLGKVVVNAAASTITAGNVTAVQEYTDAACRFIPDTGYQTVPNNTNTQIDWDITQFASSGVDQTPDLHSFVLKRSGQWMIQTSIVWSANNTGQRWFWIARNGEDDTNRLGASTIQAVQSGFTVQNITAIDRFTAGTTVRALCYQTSGSSLTILDSFGSSNIAFYWLGP